jgi:protein-disulfide isomerase
MRFCGWMIVLICAVGSVIAQETKQLQQQIDELRKGQEQIQKQLEEIRSLLKEQNAAKQSKPAAPSFLSINVHGEPFLGDAKAHVAILEYSDFDCGFCAEFATNVFPQINANYIKTGKVKFFFRDLPLPEHPFALFKAKAARCAGEQGKFWPMHDYLFAHQQPMGTSDAANLAEAVGLDPGKLSACLAADKYTSVAQRSFAGAEKYGIDGTPAFIVGTLSKDGSFLKAAKVDLGAQSYEFFQQKLDELMPANAPQPPSPTP